MIQSISGKSELAVKASVLAGREIMEVFGGQLETSFKKDDSPVTIADKRANAIITQTLKATGIPVVSEEAILPDHRIRRSWKRYWLVDPLDGTKEFIRGATDFTVNIALMENDEPVLGVILLPYFKEIFLGDKIIKTVLKASLPQLEWEENNQITWTALPQLEPTETLTVVASLSHLSEETLRYVDALKLKYGSEKIRLHRRGSAVKFCLIAEGEAQVYPRFSPSMEWDTAAGQAICEALGATMVRMQDNRPLEYNKKDLLNPAFVLSVPVAI